MSFDHRKYQPFPVIDKPDRRWPSQRIEKAPLWAAVDLRDGNQALIKPMSVAQKRRFFQMLVELAKHILLQARTPRVSATTSVPRRRCWTDSR